MGRWVVPRDWPGETVFIIAGGTSVRGQDVEQLRGRKVIAINSSYEAAPFAQYLFFGDARWWFEHRQRPALREYFGRIVTVSGAVADERLFKLKRLQPPPGLSMDPHALASQRTSLQGAMNLAFHLGAKRIVLLGADMRRAEDGRSHHHIPHKWRNLPGNETWDAQMRELQTIVAPLQSVGVEVYNTSPISRIDWWPKCELADFVG